MSARARLARGAILTMAGVVIMTIAVTGSGRGQVAENRLPSVELPQELDRVLRDYERAWRARDAEFLASLFTEDGFVLSPDRHPVRGRTNIRRSYDNSGGPLSLRALAYATEGRVGYIIGAFGRNDDEDTGKFILALQRDPDGRWSIAADMDNGS